MAINTNASGQFYLVAAMLNPTEAERLEGAKRVEVLAPTFIIAPDAAAAQNAAILKVPRDIDTDRVEVFVALPFGR